MMVIYFNSDSSAFKTDSKIIFCFRRFINCLPVETAVLSRLKKEK